MCRHSTVPYVTIPHQAPRLLTARTLRERERESKIVNMLGVFGNTRTYALMRYIHVTMLLSLLRAMTGVSRVETVRHGGPNLWEL